MSIYADQNIVLSMLYQRGEKSGNCMRTFTRKQAENVVEKYNLRENRNAVTVTEITKASTDRWGVDSMMEDGRFLLYQRMPDGSRA